MLERFGVGLSAVVELAAADALEWSLEQPHCTWRGDLGTLILRNHGSLDVDACIVSFLPILYRSPCSIASLTPQ